MPKSSRKYDRVHCNKCGHKTKHALLATCEHHGTEEIAPDFDISWSAEHDMLECCGCESVTLRCTYDHSEMGPGERDIQFYPPRSSRRLPHWCCELPWQTVELLKEVYAALHADSRRLAMMGARALIDVVILDQVGDVGNFQQKLNKLESEGYVSTKNRAVLEAALDVGNAASHRGHKPKADHVQHVMDIVENLLQASILEPIAQQLKAATPARTHKAKKAKKEVKKKTP